MNNWVVPIAEREKERESDIKAVIKPEVCNLRAAGSRCTRPLDGRDY